jgi:hypothetical protein
MKENIKIGLIGVIAITLVINTFFMEEAPRRMNPTINNESVRSNIAANPSINNPTPTVSTTPPQNTPSAPKLSESRAKTVVQFKDVAHNFGTIQQDSKNTKIFTFTNTGSTPLIIENAKGSCGCTVPKFPKEPIKPGETGEIEVVYSPGKQKGAQNKTVTITANTDPISTILNVSADVQVTEE